jgi:hypothetical protein
MRPKCPNAKRSPAPPERINDLRGEMYVGFGKMYVDGHFRWMTGFLVGAILIPIASRYFAK